MLSQNILFTVILAGACAAQSKEANSDLTLAEETLRAAKVGTDGDSLLAFFRARIPPETDLPVAIRALGSSSFEVREQASQQLERAGRLARPFLFTAQKDRDPEIAARAERCLQAIEEQLSPELVAAAALVLTARWPAGSAQVLVGYLPAACGEPREEEAVLAALAITGVAGEKADPALIKALTDKAPSRRAAGAHILGKAVPGQRPAVQRLLADAEPLVRFRAASALVRAEDRSAVPVLIALLGEGPVALAWQAEELLCRVAGEVPPPAALSKEDDISRRRCCASWEEWWKANAATADLAKVGPEEPLLGVNLVAEQKFLQPGGHRGRVWACGRDGKLLWEFDNVNLPCDVHLLPNGRILVAEGLGKCVTERDFRGKVLWECKVPGRPLSCQRLSSGNTFITLEHQLLEVTREGKVVFSIPWKQSPIWSAHKLLNGHIICGYNDGLIEFDQTGKEVHSVRLEGEETGGKIEPLSNGNYLILQPKANRVVEVDPSGKVLWQVPVQRPIGVTRLRNGHSLVRDDKRNAIEIDRSGKEVWRLTTEFPLYCVRRY